MPIRQNIPIDKLDKVPRKVMAEVERAVENALRQSGKIILREVQRATKEAGAYATGGLYKSWRVTSGKKFIAVTNTMKYAGAITSGARWKGKMPNVRNIQKWVALKLPQVRPGNRRRVAFAIARTLKKNGLRGRNFITVAGQRVASQVNTLVATALRSAPSRSRV